MSFNDYNVHLFNDNGFYPKNEDDGHNLDQYCYNDGDGITLSGRVFRAAQTV